MKKSLQFILISCLAVCFTCCNNDDNSADMAVFAVPVVKSLKSVRESVSVTAAKETASEGKIYVAEDYLFYIAKEEGVHVFDNTNPSAPQNIAFISLEGVHDIAVKGHYLFADNYIDLLVFDISDIDNITLANTLENVVEFMPAFPVEAEYYSNANVDTDEIVIGYKTEKRPRPQGYVEDLMPIGGDNLGTNESGSGSIGTGGSYARFQINQNALYTIGSYQLNVFNITDPVNAFFDKSVYMTQWFGGGQFETLFRQKGYLFVGSTTGMFVVDANDAFNPNFISGFSHATACDPVVVNGTTAYVTVRGGTSCGAIEDEVTVIDISDINNPILMSNYLLDEPHGLGIKGNILYVGCGTNGLKVFDASNASGLVLENSYADNVTDVIPLESHLIAVSPNRITQYGYGPNYTLNVLSVINF